MKLEVGTHIKQYELQERIGIGSSGEIWRAARNGQTVAIKFMRDNLLASKSAEKHRERLEREVHALQTLNHPNIPALYEWDLEFERPYFVMEYIESPSLDKLLLRGELVKKSISKRMNIIKKVASALAQAHEHDIIHRDIKPGNINGVEKPYLMDFSIALAAENREMTNFNIGTSIYMPPDIDAPDALGDAWSFAIVTYEILFGRHPIFNYDDPIIKKGMYARFEAKKHLDTGDWFKPTKLTDDQLPDDMKNADLARLDEIFTKALGERIQRYTDLNAFARDVESAVFVAKNKAAMADVAANEPKPEPQPTTQGAGMSRTVLIVGAVVVLAVVVIVVLVMMRGGG